MKTRGLAYAALLLLVVAVMIGVGSAWYTDRQTRRSEREWCDLVVTLDTAYHQTSPTTTLGRQVAEDIHNLRVRFGCP